MSAGGKLLWSRAADGKGSSSGHAVAVDRSGNCYIGGYAGGESTLGGQPIRNAAGQDILVAKFDPKGNVGWLHAGHGSSSAMIHELAADATGNVRAAGMFRKELKLADRSVAGQGEHDMLLTAFDSSGRRLWTKTAGGPGIDYGLGVALDENGDSSMTGSFTGRVEFDGVSHESRGKASDIQIVQYDRAGHLRWFVQAGGNQTDHAYTIVSDGKGSLYLSGACQGNATFGDHAIQNRGSNDIFLAKLKGR
jgi:outer membrane protein assembly factor BamB